MCFPSAKDVGIREVKAEISNVDFLKNLDSLNTMFLNSLDQSNI